MLQIVTTALCCHLKTTSTVLQCLRIESQMQRLRAFNPNKCLNSISRWAFLLVALFLNSNIIFQVSPPRPPLLNPIMARETFAAYLDLFYRKLKASGRASSIHQRQLDLFERFLDRIQLLSRSSSTAVTSLASELRHSSDSVEVLRQQHLLSKADQLADRLFAFIDSYRKETGTIDCSHSCCFLADSAI